MARFKQRAVWSPECGGCIMFQRYDRGSKSWIDWRSQSEGEYPTHDVKARHAADLLRTGKPLCVQKMSCACAHHARGGSLLSACNTNERGMTAYERAERSGDAY